MVCAFLLLPAVALAAKAPSLASTSQYKAFVAYVKKLDGLIGQPITATQKDAFEAELSTKKEAAAHKANALFKRSSEEALAESNAKYKEQAAAIRRGEEGELEALGVEFGAKLDRATAGYQAKLARIVNGRRSFESRAHEQIDALRATKAQTADVAQKNAIQEQITGLSGEISSKRQEESQKRAELKAAFGKQKEEIHTAQAKQETAIGEAAEAKIEKASTHWKNVYNTRKSTLNSKRESQLGYLEAKLEKGRADIAAMPAA
jgi:predicted HicB family RNase H-like nuclease